MIGTDFVFVETAGATGAGRGRYEYRVWPRPWHPAVALLQSGWPLVNAERRTDIYLVTPEAERDLVKLRDGERLEIKRLGAGGRPLQHWRVEVARGFPLTTAELAALSATLGLPGGLPADAALSSAHLLAELSRFAGPVAPRTVRKSRLLFRSRDCRAEICRVSIGGWTGLTVALDSEDRAAVAAAVDGLRLGGLPNRSYGEVLLRLAAARTGPPATLETDERRLT